MKSKTTILVAVLTWMLISDHPLLVAQPRFPDAEACRIIDQKRATQFVSFEGDASAQEVTLRLHNNTSCSIVVETDDRSPTHVTKLPDGRMKFEVVDGSADGAKIGLHYNCYVKRDDRNLRQLVVSMGNRNVLFVPRASFLEKAWIHELPATTRATERSVNDMRSC